MVKRSLADEYEAARVSERGLYETMTHAQLVTALRGAMAACRIADRLIDDLRRDVEERDKSLREWARAFAPNRPLGTKYPPMES